VSSRTCRTISSTTGSAAGGRGRRDIASAGHSREELRARSRPLRDGANVIHVNDREIDDDALPTRPRRATRRAHDRRTGRRSAPRKGESVHFAAGTAPRRQKRLQCVTVVTPLEFRSAPEVALYPLSGDE
jgi:hypothetical protein